MASLTVVLSKQARHTLSGRWIDRFLRSCMERKRRRETSHMAIEEQDLSEDFIGYQTRPPKNYRSLLFPSFCIHNIKTRNQTALPIAKQPFRAFISRTPFLYKTNIKQALF